MDLLDEILHRMDSNLSRSSYQVLPWHKGYYLVRTTPDSLLFSTVRLPEREELFLWAGPVISCREVIFTLADTNRQGNIDITRSE